jgi:hypothetical protein
MAVIANLEADLTIKTASFKAALDRATADLQQFGTKSGGVVQRIKDSFGKGSVFGQAAMIFAGSGAVRGITMAEKALENMTARAVELKRELDAGKISTADFGAEFVKSIPLVDHIAGMISNIHEAITGDADALKQANDEAKRMTDIQSAIVASYKAGEKALGDQLAVASRLRSELGLIGASDSDKAIAEKFGAVGKDLSDAVKTFAGSMDEVLNPKGKDSFDELKKKIAQAKFDTKTPIPELTHTGGPGIGIDKNGLYVNTGTNQKERDAAIKKVQDAQKLLYGPLSLQKELDARLAAARPMSGAALGNIALVGMKAGKELALSVKNGAASITGSLGDMLGLGPTKPLPKKHDEKISAMVQEQTRRAKQIMEEMKTPLERIVDDVAEVNGLWAGGLLTLSDYNKKMAELNGKVAELNAKPMKMPTLRPNDPHTVNAPIYRFPTSNGVNPMQQLSRTMERSNGLLTLSNQAVQRVGQLMQRQISQNQLAENPQILNF